MVNWLTKWRKTAETILARGRAGLVQRSPGLTSADWLQGGGTNLALDRPYEISPWVMRAIKIVADPIAATPLKVYERRGQEEVPINDERLSELIAAPALAPDGLMRLPDFIEANVALLKLQGECFWILDDTYRIPFPELQRSGLTYSPVLLAKSHQMYPITRGAELIAWRYQWSGGSVTLPREQVIQVKFWSPYNDVRGVSELGTCALTVESDLYASRFLRDINANNGEQGAFVLAEDSTLSESQMDQIRALLKQKRALQKSGHFVPVFLNASKIRIEEPKLRAPDAAFLQAKLHNRHEIFLAFGVPPSMADITASYSIGSASDLYRLIENTCKPLSRKLEAAFSTLFRRVTGRNLIAWFEWDEHTVMQAARRERMDTASKLFGMGVPMAVINRVLDLGLPRFDGDDVGYLPLGIQPVSEVSFGLDEVPSELSASIHAPRCFRPGNISRKLRLLLQASMHSKEAQPDIHHAPEHTHSHEVQPTVEVKEEEADPRWRRVHQHRAAFVKKFESKIRRVIMDARAETLQNLQRRSESLGPNAVTRAAAADFIFSLQQFTADLLAQMRTVSISTLDLASKQTLAELGYKDPWKYPPEKVTNFLKAREPHIVGAAEEMHRSIMDALNLGIAKGETMDELADRVKEAFNGLSNRRARVIAMTESGMAYNTARHETMAGVGVKMKRWLSSGLVEKMRPAHAAMHNTVVPINEPFVVTNPDTNETDSVQFPGDPSGAPWNVINCYCTEVAELSEE